MRPRLDVRAPPFDHGRLLGLIARHRAGELTRREIIELDAVIEDYLARQGTAVVMQATAQIVDLIIAGENVTVEELDATMYAVWSGPLSEHWQPDEPEAVPV